MLSVRCSSLPRLSACPASAVPPAVALADESAEARLGTAFHKLISLWIGAGRDPDLIEEVARFQAEDLDREELTFLVEQAWNLWIGHDGPALRAFFPRPAVEVELPSGSDGPHELSGHADLLGFPQPGEVAVLDWKSGWGDADPWEQLTGYAYLACGSFRAERARGCIVRVREGTAEWRSWTRAELAEWWSGLSRRIRSGGDLYNPSASNCRYCPRRLECPALRSLSQAAGALILRAAAGELPMPVAPASLCELFDAWKLLEKLCAEVGALVRAQVAAQGGQVDAGSGTQLVLTSQERRTIRAGTALPILREWLTEADLAECLSVGKTKVEHAVRALAPRGQKTEAIDVLRRRLEEAGAYQVETVQRLELRRVPLKVEVAK